MPHQEREIRRAPEKVTLLLALRKFIPAARAHALFFILTLLGGIGLLALHYEKVHVGKWKPEDRLAVLVEHLGVALIVSAVAVFGYEWNAHINDTNDLDELVKEDIEESRSLKSSLGIAGRLEAAMKAKGKDGLGPCLDAALNNDGKSEGVALIRGKFHDLVNALVKLLDTPTWATDNQVAFLSVLLDTFVMDNVNNLVVLSQAAGEQRFTITAPPQWVAGQLLVAQMRSMKEDDEYLVVSDVKSWRDGHLGDFVLAQNKAIADKGIRVRRIFNVVRDFKDLDKSDICQILRQHFQKASYKGRGYKIAVITEKEAGALVSEGMRRERVEGQHFGLFVHGKDKMLFRVEEENLSDLSLSIAKNLTDSAQETFDKMWSKAREIKTERDIKNLLAELQGPTTTGR